MKRRHAFTKRNEKHLILMRRVAKINYGRLNVVILNWPDDADRPREEVLGATEGKKRIKINYLNK